MRNFLTPPVDTIKQDFAFKAMHCLSEISIHWGDYEDSAEGISDAMVPLELHIQFWSPNYEL